MKRATPYLLLGPALLFTVFILAYPLVQNVINSLRDVTMMGNGDGWNGFRNYAAIVGDELFWLSFKNTLLYALCGTLGALAVGLGLSLLLNVRLGRISSVAGFIYTVPWVVSPVVAGFAWKWLLNDNFGIINYWLVRFGVVEEGPSWLGDPATALVCVAVARIWQFYPFAMVMFLAALQTIPEEQYEAAAVDGASAIRTFFSITLPNLRPVGSVLLVLGMIWSFNDFNMVFVMTRGGPINSSMVLPVLVKEVSFVYFDLGKGSAISIVIFSFLVLLSLIYIRMLSEKEGT